MATKFLSKIFGSRNERVVKRLLKSVAQINDLEAGIQSQSDEELKSATDGLRQRLADGQKLDALLPEAFALVREAARRSLGMRHFDVQLVGGMVLDDGKIAEMRTGEGKTLVATLAAYLNALPGKGVHVVTVNDYLARRDAAWMGRVYHFLGLSVGVINSSGGFGPDSSSYRFDPDYVPEGDDGYLHMRPCTRRDAYAADITYGTNNEFGFDYLRDNMAFALAEKSQRDLHFAIVDEVDSILVDEARTPLIISGPTDDTSDLYVQVNKLIPELKRQDQEESVENPGDGDYYVDEKTKQVYFTEQGHGRVEELLVRDGLLTESDSLYDSANIVIMHHLMAALRAHALFQRDVDYIVRSNEVVIVDEFTGRTMPGRRWSDGLHQAVEAKEGVAIQHENQTLASITFQNYFRLYDKLSGMTGTADTEAYEFQQIYGLEVVVIPTHKPMIRDDRPDLVYLTQREKFAAIIEDIKDCRQRQQPALVGTASIETSEYVARLLNESGIDHQVLNAKQHEREAHVVAQAGRPGAVTIATNMAGRGTDIVLGGNLQAELEELPADATEEQREAVRREWQQRHDTVIRAGGLHIVGTERHESRRIDNQLRGRSGRQGDAGSSRFYLSLEDNLMRIFASERVSGLMQKLGMEEGEAIEHPWVNKAIENAQRKVEGRNFDIRKQLLEFDDVANDQRKVIYEQRSELMAAEDISETIQNVRADIVNGVIDTYIPPHSLEEMWDVPGLTKALEEEFTVRLDIQGWLDADHELHEETLRDRILDAIDALYKEKESAVGEQVMRHFEKAVMLQTLDAMWKEHLASMDYLRQGIYLRGYAQKNPKQEYKREAFEMFSGLLERIKHEVVRIVSRVRVQDEADVAAIEARRRQQAAMEFSHPNMGTYAVAPGAAEAMAPPPEGMATGGNSMPDEQGEAAPQPFVREGRKVGRNEPCPCGSGKKYKHCHGRLA